MNVLPPRILTVGTIVLILASAGWADNDTPVQTEIEARLARIESRLATSPGPRQAGYQVDAGDVPSCSDLDVDRACDDARECRACCCESSGGGYAAFQFNFFRAHLPEGAVIFNSKLSEEYELSPRMIVGYENRHGHGARARYWHHGHQHDDLNSAGGVRFEWDVFDAEYTRRLAHGRHDVVLAAGVRLADVNLVYPNWDAHTSLVGGTVAADVRSPICCRESSAWALVYGGRLAILTGDSNGGTQGLVRDLNWRVWEIYGAAEQRCRLGDWEVRTQLGFEIQNWLPDQALGQPPAARDASFGFVGPSFRLAVDF